MNFLRFFCFVSLFLIAASKLSSQPFEPDEQTSGLWHFDQAGPPDSLDLRHYQFSARDHFVSAIQTRDNCVCILGWGRDAEGANEFFFITKIDSVGEAVWTRELMNHGDRTANDLVLLADNRIAVAGSDEDNFPYVMILDENGEQLSNTAFQIEGFTKPDAIAQDREGALVVFATRQIPGVRFGAAYIFKTSVEGELMWDFQIQREDGPIFHLEGTVNESNEIFAGYYGSEVGQNIIKLSPDGELLWSIAKGNEEDEYRLSKMTVENEMILLGGTYTERYHGMKALVTCLDSDGETLWEFDYGIARTAVRLHDFLRMEDGGFTLAVAAIEAYQPRLFFNPVIVRFDSQHEFLWRRYFNYQINYGVPPVYYPSVLIRMEDTSFNIVGKIDGNESEHPDIYAFITAADPLFIKDSSPFESEGSVSGAVEPSEGFFQNSMRIGEEFGTVFIPDNECFHSDRFTLEAWIKLDGEIEHDGVILAKRIDAERYSYLFKASNDHNDLSLGLYTTEDSYLCNAEVMFLEDRWRYVCATYDGETISLYIDGQLASQVETRGEVVYGGGGLFIGSDGEEFGDHLIGSIDEVRISSCVREPLYIESNYREQVPSKQRLVSFFPNPFNDALSIRFNANPSVVGNIRILDINGRTVSDLGAQTLVSGSKIIWNASDLPSGEYIVNVDLGRRIIKEKVLLLR